MKRKCISWMTILMVAIMSVGFMSCGGGDDDVKKESEVSLVGTWLLNLDSDCYLLLTFSQSGTVRIQEYDSGEWEEDEVYHYTFSNGILRITNENGKERETIEVISLSDTKLVLKDWPDGGMFTFVKQ